MESGCSDDFYGTYRNNTLSLYNFSVIHSRFFLPVYEWSPVICPPKWVIISKTEQEKSNWAPNIASRIFVQVGATMLESVALREVAVGLCTDLLTTIFRGEKIKLNLCIYLRNHQCLCSLMDTQGQGVDGANATEGPAGTWQRGPWTSQPSGFAERFCFALAKTS